MRISVVRKVVKFVLDSNRVVARYFMNDESRTQKMVTRIMSLDENQVSCTWYSVKLIPTFLGMPEKSIEIFCSAWSRN